MMPRRTRVGAALGALLGLLGGMAATGQVTPESPGWFPFVMSPLRAPDGAFVDLKGFGGGAPAESRLQVRDGHFVTAAGQRLRLFGTNLTFAANFPDKQEAPAFAERLARLGFNVIRLHHLDKSEIWRPDGLTIDPEKLDRLDWLVFQLKQRGVYVNLNLHVSRIYPPLRDLQLDPRVFGFGKVFDYYYPPLIALQRDYAQALLAHVNPYTGRRWADDPAVAFVEVNNENSLLNLPLDVLTGDRLPAFLRHSLQEQWGQWLTDRYGSPAALARAWNAGLPRIGPELLAGHDFARPTPAWAFEAVPPENARLVALTVPGTGPIGRFEIAQPGAVSWSYQAHWLGLPLAEGQPSLLRFRARADRERLVTAAIVKAGAPWTTYSERRRFRVGPEWREYLAVLTPVGNAPDDPLRLTLNLGPETGTVELAGPSLRAGGKPFSPAGLASCADVPLPVDNLSLPTASADFIRFLIAAEHAYVREMRRFLREDLGVKSLLVTSQASYGGYWGLRREAAFSDYIDMHSYWQHPQFPGQPWDPVNWQIGNSSMVAHPENSAFLALLPYRVAGMPFVVSEYNHPAPNDYAAECLPMLASFASYQDWDAVYQFCYGNDHADPTAGRLVGYFILANHAAQAVFAPAAAVLFRMGAIPPATGERVYVLPREQAERSLSRWSHAPGPKEAFDMLPWDTPLLYPNRVATVLADAGQPHVESRRAATPPSDTIVPAEALTWELRGETARYLVRTGPVRMAIGNIGGSPLPLRDASIHVLLPAGTWACAALVALDGQAVADSRKLLLSLATRVENVNMGWNAERSSLGANWGQAPTLAQGVPAAVLLPGATAPVVRALDPDGVPLAPPLPVAQDSDGRWKLIVGPQYRTLWYAIERPLPNR